MKKFHSLSLYGYKSFETEWIFLAKFISFTVKEDSLFSAKKIIIGVRMFYNFDSAVICKKKKQ